MGTLRQGLSQFEIYNDGSLLFIYDSANTQAILETVPADDNYPLDERNLDRAVRAGLIVLVELFQDDEIRCEVGVGNPLTLKEKAGVPWLPPAVAHLWLPSGKLRVDSANSLALIPEEADEKGAEFSCEPGHYRVCIDRLSWDELDEADEYDSADNVITLKKISEKEFTENDNVLIKAEYIEGNEVVGQLASAPQLTTPMGTIKDGIFHGHVYFDENKSFWLNLTPSLAEKLKLEYVKFDLYEDEVPTDLVRIDIGELNMTVRGCINGRRYFEMSKKQLSRVGQEVATGLAPMFFVDGQEMIRFSWDRNTRKIKKSECERWFGATLQQD